MAKLLKLRRGTTSEHSSFTGAEGEVTIDTTKDTAVVHDGSTAGGHPLVKENAEVTSTGIASNVVDEDNLKVSNTPTNGQYLQAQSGASGGLTWSAVSQTPEGTAVLSTGESGGTKFLREDGDGSSSWQAIPVPTEITVTAENTTAATVYPTFVGNGASSTGNLDISTDTGLSYNPSTGMFTSAGFTGALTGNATTATKANSVQVDATTDANCFPMLTASGATGQKAVKSSSNLSFNSSTGLLNCGSLALTGDLTVNGTTTTVATTNTTITDNLIELNSGASSNANDAGILIERGSTGDNAIFAWDESADKFIVGTTTGTASSTGDITIAAATLVTSTVEDSKGNLRSIPANVQTSAYTLVASDAGKFIRAQAAISVPNNLFSEGDAVTIVNNTGSDITINQQISFMYNSADGSTGNRTLAARGGATILFISAGLCYISGAGLS